jgi:hypothetical protein
MYKNFTLTESEKVKILNMHKKHGYKKPLNEEDDMVSPEETDMGSSPDQSMNEPKMVTLIFQEYGSEETGEYENDLSKAKVFLDSSKASDYQRSIKNGVQIRVPLI